VAEESTTATGMSKAPAKHTAHKVKSGVPTDLFFKMEPTDLQKFDGGVHVTLLMDKRPPKKRKKHPKKRNKPKPAKKSNS
jgi:hypothetical protein